jgi:putative transposase
MPIRTIKLEAEAFYHVYNRGHNKQILFFKEEDFQRFIRTIKRYLKKHPSIEILAFSLLPNHFHLLLQSSESGREISVFMRKIQQSYAIHFNIKYKNTRKSRLKHPVFEGRFKAKTIENEEYLHSTFFYVELNPIKHNIVSDIKDWPYSSIHMSL